MTPDKLQKKLVLLSVLGLLTGACTDHSNTEKLLFYPNGVLYKRITKKHGYWNGPVWTYYSNGHLKSKVFWRDGVQHGPAFFYYSNGHLQEVTQWREGKAQGKSLLYYRNGKLARQSAFAADVEVGKVTSYDSTGKHTLLEELDKSGRIVRMRDYDKTGVLSGRGLMPLIEAPDTIQLGELYMGCVHFGYPLAGQPRMLIGKLLTNKTLLDRYQLVDTLAIVRPDRRGWFCFSYKPQFDKSGEQVFAYKFLQPGHEFDSLSIHWLSGTHNFYVKARPKAL